MSEQQQQRPFDIILFGTSGYTGQCCLRHIAKAKDTTLKGIKFGFAGRSQPRVAEALRAAGIISSTSSEGSSSNNNNIIIADSSDADSLNKMCSQCHVLISTVGPFCAYGMPVVEACVKNSTNYVDVTGEWCFQNRVAERFHDEAREKQIQILSCCAFDSLPSSLTTLYLNRKKAVFTAKDITHIKLSFELINSAGFSGGTMLTTASMLRYVKLRDLHPLSLTPSVALNDDKEKRNSIPADLKPYIAPPGGFPVHLKLSTSKLFKNAWVCPFMLSGTNEKNVRKQLLLLGKNCSYVEHVHTKSIVEALQYVGLMLSVIFLSFPVIGSFLLWLFAPRPGDGPSEEKLKKSSFECLAAGWANSDGSETGAPVVKARLACAVDCYVFSGIGAVETAAAVLRKEFNAEAVKKGTSWTGGGVNEPGAVVGDALLRRLSSYGCQWSAMRGDAKDWD